VSPAEHAVHVAVVGPADAGDDLLATAHAVGRALAHARAVVVTGGLGGVMAAASRGATEAGGTTLGILPGTDRDDANPWVTYAVPTGLGQARNSVVVLAADVVVAVGGSWGTLTEVAHALRAGRPVVAVAGWRVTDEAGSAVEGAVHVPDPEAAVAAALALAAEAERDRNHS
jgi:uncharacterized protein (TIGR00725 family)